MAVVSPGPQDTSAVARALLAAADKLGLPATVVATTTDGAFGTGFVVPDELMGVFGEFMESAHEPIHVSLTAKANQEPEPELAVDEEPEPEPEPEPEAKPKRGPGRPRKTVAAETETEE